MPDSIKVDLSSDEFGDQLAKRVSAYLVRLFPREPAEFWAALCEQAYHERERLGAMADLVCMGEQDCPFKQEVVGGVRFRALRPRQRDWRPPAFRWSAEAGCGSASAAVPEPAERGQDADAGAGDPVMQAFREGRLKPLAPADSSESVA